MLHTGTMFAVIVYFWSQWKQAYFTTAHAFKRFVVRAAWATVLTGVVGYPLIEIIERTAFKGHTKGEIEMLFSRLDLIAPALLAAGILILLSGLRERAQGPGATARPDYERSIVLSGDNVTFSQAGWMGAIQGLCLPFRGFSRSGATISTGLLTGANRQRAERFSFALAVIITPLAIAREAHAPAQGKPPRDALWPAARSACQRISRSARHGVFVLRGLGRVALAQLLAGARPLVPLRHLLPGSQRRRLLPSPSRLLRKLRATFALV